MSGHMWAVSSLLSSILLSHVLTVDLVREQNCSHIFLLMERHCKKDIFHWNDSCCMAKLACGIVLVLCFNSPKLDQRSFQSKDFCMKKTWPTFQVERPPPSEKNNHIPCKDLATPRKFCHRRSFCSRAWL